MRRESVAELMKSWKVVSADQLPPMLLYCSQYRMGRERIPANFCESSVPPYPAADLRIHDVREVGVPCRRPPPWHNTVTAIPAKHYKVGPHALGQREGSATRRARP